jgi:hypothetical protein
MSVSELIHLAQSRTQWLAFENTVMNFPVHARRFSFDQLINCQILEKGCSPNTSLSHAVPLSVYTITLPQGTVE